VKKRLFPGSDGNTTENMNILEAEIAISELHSTGDYRVLRKLNLERDSRFTNKPVPDSAIALCIDTETTGMDFTADTIIEIGMVAFEYDPRTADIIRICDRYSAFEDPGMPLPEEIREITGITDEMVAGRAFDDGLVHRIAQKAGLVIAHNAAFDRKFVEQRFPVFAGLPWACTVSQLDWRAERISSRSLEYLLYKCGGYYINAHRALDDAEGVLGLLLADFPVSNQSIFRALLQNSGEMTSKICAVGAPFDKKDILKQRGYRWDDGSKGGSKGWWLCVPQDAEEDELAYLATEIYSGGNARSVEINRIDAFARFSVREE
jgi:DNA polymerase-3 subunit epsilon